MRQKSEKLLGKRAEKPAGTLPTRASLHTLVGPLRRALSVVSLYPQSKVFSHFSHFPRSRATRMRRLGTHDFHKGPNQGT